MSTLNIHPGHVPLKVTAHLEGGIAWAGPWGIALDGLLASQLHDPTTPETPLLEQPTPADLDLPLSRCTSERDPDLWHWTATVAHPIDGHGLLPETRYFSARTDSRHLEALADHLPERIRDREGRYRVRYAPLLVTICSAVTWYAVGAPEALHELLAGIPAIGKQRRAGHGAVTRWDITTPPSLSPWQAGHLHPDNTLGRPVPNECLLAHPNTPAGHGWAGLRPPYIHPARQHELRVPLDPAMT